MDDAVNHSIKHPIKRMLGVGLNGAMVFYVLFSLHGLWPYIRSYLYYLFPVLDDVWPWFSFERPYTGVFHALKIFCTSLVVSVPLFVMWRRRARRVLAAECGDEPDDERGDHTPAGRVLWVFRYLFLVCMVAWPIALSGIFEQCMVMTYHGWEAPCMDIPLG